MNLHLQNALQLIDEATSGMTDEQLAWHPEGKWSSCNILEHLTLAFGGTVKGLDRMLTAGKPECRSVTLKDRLQVALVVEIGYFPSGRKAPEMVVPQGITPQQALKSIRENLEAVDKTISKCEQKIGGRQKLLNHPILGPLNAREWRKFHYVHTRHHMKQVRALRERLLTKGD